MVKKLFKHEFLFYARIMGLVYGILLAISVAARVIFTFESDTTAYQIVESFTFLAYYVAFLAAIGSAFVLGIVRFYRNMFTSEGYLSFTLPVTVSQHIIVKAVSAVCVEFISLLVVFVSALIVLPSEILDEFGYAFSIIFGDIPTDAVIHLVLYCVEFAILAVLAAFTGVLQYYCFICIGQLSKKNRILAAVGAYFAWYMITQVFATIFTILVATFAASGAMEPVAYWIAMHPVATVHISLCGGIVLGAFFLIAEFLIAHHIMSKKLNLE